MANNEDDRIPHRCTRCGMRSRCAPTISADIICFSCGGKMELATPDTEEDDGR